MPSSPRILLVDDEEGFRFAAGVALRRGGYRLEEAADGKEALAKIVSARRAGDPIDLVVTDIRMPVMSGIELIDAIAADDLRVPVCAITCFGDRTLVAELAGKGCAEYLEKPFEPEELVSWVGEQLERRRK
ncbi:MAG TPA: response regulator [Thermoanaerobaculia bacterium]|nr:response regulator [Thermoanaerobaculia bacterium]